jgi:hypothetical protein
MPRTLASYLADLSHGELEHMLSDIRQARNRVEEEVRNLEFEEGLVTQALGRKSRRTTPGSTTSRVTRQQVLALVTRSFEQRFTPSEALQVFEREGITLAAESLRQHLRKLVSEGKLARDGNAYVFPGRSHTPTSNGHAHAQATGASPNGAQPGGGEREGMGLQVPAG